MYNRIHKSARTGAWRKLALPCLLGVMLLAGPAWADYMVWSYRTQAGPGVRTGVDLVWDGQAVMLFGSHGPLALVLDDTWLWDGTRWRQHDYNDPNDPNQPRPDARYGYCMAYDAGRGVVVLYGGTTGTDRFGDTWEWDGNRWTRVDAGDPNGITAPRPRQGCAMAYDPQRGVIVLFGGNHQEHDCLGDTWEWNGSNWTQIEPNAPVPSPRYHHTMAYDQATGTVLLFGGWCGTELDDTWRWDGGSWIPWTPDPNQPVPHARSNHAMTSDADRGKVVLHGGTYGGTFLDDTWEWNGSAWEQVPTLGPSARSNHGMTYDPVRRRIVMCGGEPAGAAATQQTWEYCGHLIGDINGDGVVSFGDINPFVDLLLRVTGVR